MKSCTIILSKVLVRTGVIDIGRKAECWVGAVTFGTGQIQACFHWRGTAEVESERLNSWVMWAQKIGAATRRNHEGMPSSPVAVEQSVSKILKTRHSEMKSLLGFRTVCFNARGV